MLTLLMVSVAAGLALPAGVVIGLVGTAAVAPRDYPAFDPREAEGRAAIFAAPPRSGVGQAPQPVEASPALDAARVRLLEAHGAFLRRERYASAILDRYRPTPTRPGRRATPALLRMLARTARAHEAEREKLAALPVPGPLASAHFATLSMLDAAAQAHREVIAAARRRDPEFALVRETGYTRALGSHFAALEALRAVPPAGTRASIEPPKT
ncbi:MAG TPA: hypothetical protein VF406_18545 [Thermodesulfobacteriota bacterium]